MSNLNENMPARRVEDNRQAGPLAWDGAAPPAGQRTVAPITVDQLEHLNPSRTGLGIMERREGGTYVRVADVRRMDAARAAAGVPAHEQDLLDIVRTLCSTAQRLAELSPAQRANYPSPLSPMSPLFQAASAACVERGYTRWGLEIEGAAYPAPAAQPAPVAATGLLAEALAVFDLMLVGCNDQNFGDYQNGDGEEIGPRMDALHAKLRAACAGAPATAETGVGGLTRYEPSPKHGGMIERPHGSFFSASEVKRLLASLAPVAAEPVRQWIDLKVQKPKDWQRVMVALDTGTVATGYRGSSGWHWDETDHPEDVAANATHWQPWPDHPRNAAPQVLTAAEALEKAEAAVRTLAARIKDFPERTGEQEAYNEALEHAIAAIRGIKAPAVCAAPPAGWHCTRKPGHDGPCAAWPAVAPSVEVKGEQGEMGGEHA